MKAFRPISFIKSACRFELRRRVPYFSSLSSSDANPRFSNHLFDAIEEGGSSVYQYALKFQRPTTITWNQRLHNSVSFIGSINGPLKTFSKNGRFRVFTKLAVHDPQSNRMFWLSLDMVDDIAEVASKHLKPNDFVYVWGQLRPWTCANLRTLYKVDVKELNYVTQLGQSTRFQKYDESRSWKDSSEFGLEKYRNRLHLWQLFFANPYEWWDNRKSKVSTRRPDFKHKDTGEALWLSPDDPQWIKRQLKLHDMKMAGRDREECEPRHARLSVWEFE